MKGCSHIASVISPGEWGSRGIRTPGVMVHNDDDPHYDQIFETQAELDEFIEELRKAGLEAFGRS